MATINLISNLTDSTFSHIALEVTSLADLRESGMYFDIHITEYIVHNLKLKNEKKEKTCTFFVSLDSIKKITCFFPDKEKLMDDRSDFFRTLDTETAFLPSKDALGAYESMILSTYRYQEYLTKKKEYVFDLVVSSREHHYIEEKIPLYNAIIEARNLINMPPRDANPESLVHHTLSYKWKQFDVQVFDQNELEKIGCNLILAVGAGSTKPPYMILLVPKKPQKWEKYALVGKGVTFDAGGIQIKPDTAMLDMKCDMSWAAAVLGVAKCLDSLPHLPANVIIAVGLTENMTGGNAYKPLDIYKAYNGTSVEIHHTDAEGRLVLADVMSYVEKNHKPEHIITIATLTGACVYALGHDIAGIMGDDEEIIRQLIDNTSPYEPVWRLPLNDKLKKSLKAEIADLKNVARSEKAGSSIGGAFLSYFQGDAKLTHLDIAGPAYRVTNWGYMPKGGTGWWVKKLSELLMNIGKNH